MNPFSNRFNVEERKKGLFMEAARSKFEFKLPLTQGTVQYASSVIKQALEHWYFHRHRWMHNIPSEECDVVITFRVNMDEYIIFWLVSCLKGSGLNVRLKLNSNKDRHFCYITASVATLLKCAEEYHLPKRLSKKYGGGLKEFLRCEASKFECVENGVDFFTTQERQWLISRLLQNLRAKSADKVDFLHLVEGHAIVPKCVSNSVISQIYPVHDMENLKYLRNSWIRQCFQSQPIDAICEYFGVKTAMYFAWLGHYTTALCIPAIVGIFFWLISWRLDQTKADTGFVLFSFFNVVWFGVYLEAWKRYCAELAYKWGTLDQRDELLLEPRPLFAGDLKISPVTSRLEPFYPNWKRNVFRYCVSVPVILACISIVVFFTILNFKFQDWWDRKIETFTFSMGLSYVPKVLLAVIISFMDEIYNKIARFLNDRENYRLDREYENNLIIKVSTFQFVNSFLSLFYIAFYLQDQQRLKVQLAVLLITRQVIRNIKESALPFLIEQCRLAKLSFDIFGALTPNALLERRKLDDNLSRGEDSTSPDDIAADNERNNIDTIPRIEIESNLFKYEGTFSEYLEMFVQLGYVVLFSSAFPLAAFCALLNNLLEIRSDAFKLCFLYQRPFGERVSNIGTWLNVMEAMGLMAVFVNCALIALSGQVHRMFPDMSKTQTILLIVALEHIMLLVRFLINCLIPDLPDWIATEMAKVEFARREAVNGIPSANSSPPEQLLPPEKALAETSSSSSSLSGTTEVANGVRETMMMMKVSKDEDFYDSLSEPNPARTKQQSPCSDYSFDNIDRILKNVEKEESILSWEGACNSPKLTDFSRSVTVKRGHVPTGCSNTMEDGEKQDTNTVVEESRKTRLKRSLIKRARSVAAFSLKLKEKREKCKDEKESENSKGSADKMEKIEKSTTAMETPKLDVGGELSCVPIEMLISIDDVNQMRKRNSTNSNNKSATPSR